MMKLYIINDLSSMIFVLYLHQKIWLSDILFVYAFIQLLFLNHLRHHHTLLVVKVTAKTFMSQVSKFMSISLSTAKWKHSLDCFSLYRFKSDLFEPINVYSCAISSFLNFLFLLFVIFIIIFSCFQFLIIFYAFYQVLLLFFAQVLRRTIRIIYGLIFFRKLLIYNFQVFAILLLRILGYFLNLGAQIWGIIGC